MKEKKRATWGGRQVKGIVFKADYNGALIDIGAKAPAYLPLEEACIYKLKSVEEVGLVAGVEEEFSIIRDDDKNGRMILSLKKLQNDFSWERCRQLQMDDVTIRGKVLLHYNNRRLFLSQGEFQLSLLLMHGICIIYRLYQQTGVEWLWTLKAFEALFHSLRSLL
jgi:hypothetical protein